MLPANQRSIWLLLNTCANVIVGTVGCTTQRLQERIKQHVPKAIRQRATLTQEQGTHRSQPTRTQPNRKRKATQFQPESDSAIGQHLLESNQCARIYFDSQFKILTTVRSQFHLSLFEAVNFSQKKTNRFVQAKTVRIYPSTVSIRSEPVVTK